MSNDGLLPNMPSPEDRQRAIEHALKNSKWAHSAFKEKTDEEKARLRLEEFTVGLMKTCLEVRRLDEEKTGQPYDKNAMSRLIMSMFQDFFHKESRESLEFMFAMVHTPICIEAIDEVVL